jgi:hypothetical protein
MNSTPPCIRFFTGLTNLEGLEARKIPGKNFSLATSSSPEEL